MHRIIADPAEILIFTMKGMKNMKTKRRYYISNFMTFIFFMVIKRDASIKTFYDFIGIGRFKLYLCCSNIFMAITLFLVLSFGTASISRAADTNKITSEWGGHIRLIVTQSDPNDQSIYQFTDTGTFDDYQSELRIKNQTFLGSRWTLETHYEWVGQKGDTLENNNRLRTILPAATANQLLGNGTINDDRRFMNLTHPLDDGDDFNLYHRLDRLNLTFAADPATVRLGRQALTWGNGILFNPMDLFNPFAPTTIQRDYKAGDDMLHIEIPIRDSEVQLLYLPRRNPGSGDIESNQASFAGKWHVPVKAIEFDFMAASHYDNTVAGAGASGSIGGAAWRSDIIYTFLDDDASQNDYWQFIANIDYAWQWGGKTTYGLIEFYYNSLGEDQDYAAALSDPLISQRISRGELFTLGRIYLAGQLQIELHPLVQTQMTSIVNLADPSTIFQLQLVWDMATDLQLIAGANFNFGGSNTEFGGFDFNAAGTNVKVAPADNRYLWLTYYF